MNIDFLGHATLLVRGREGTVLFDPLLFGIHHEGLYDVFPPRTLDLKGLPQIDLVVVTHRHLDHFDLESLTALPRAIPIAVTDDPLLVRCISALGFKRVKRIANFESIGLGSMKLTATPAAAGGEENGWLIEEGPAVAWNLVDTVPGPEAIAAVKATNPEIDLAIVPWQPLQDVQFPTGEPIVFPYRFYDMLHRNALQIGAKEIATGACGFRAVGHGEWTNQLLFPIPRARFVLDAATANPSWSGAIHTPDPGDVIEVDAGRVRHHRQRLPYCRSEPYDWAPLAWRPHLLGYPVAEATPEFSLEATRDAVEAFFDQELPDFVAANRSRFEWNFRWEVRHQFEVVFHDGSLSFLLDFSGASLTVTHERSPLALAQTAITAGALIGLVADAISWDLVLASGLYRYHQHTYRVESTGLVRPADGLLLDPLANALGGAASLERKMIREINRLGHGEPAGAVERA